MKKILFVVPVIMAAAAVVWFAVRLPAAPGTPLKVKVLILPKFEVGELAGDVPGEAQYYFEQYLTDAEVFDIPNGADGAGLYYKNGVALSLTGMGKVGAALSTMAILSDSRFDYSEAYIIATGCAGSSAGTTVMGDVFVITSAVDYDLGHHADGREIADPDGTTWFHDTDYDDSAAVFLDRDLTDKVYALVKDTPVETTERTRNFMRAAFDGADWALRDPQVLKGTSVSGDNYWKGKYGHENALRITDAYQCPDPYAVTEMEDVAIARAVRRMGLLDHLIILRDSVNLDVFNPGVTPEILWGGANMDLSDENSIESADIFATAMKNNFEVGRTIIDRILDGSF